MAKQTEVTSAEKTFGASAVDPEMSHHCSKIQRHHDRNGPVVQTHTAGRWPQFELSLQNHHNKLISQSKTGSAHFLTVCVCLLCDVMDLSFRGFPPSVCVCVRTES